MKIGSWKKVKKNSLTTVWRNSVSDEEITVKNSHIKYGGWKSSVATGLKSIVFLTRKEAEDDAIMYMRDFPHGEKSYYKNFGFKKVI